MILLYSSEILDISGFFIVLVFDSFFFNLYNQDFMFEIYQSEKSGEFYFRLKASNGQIILSSEGYKQKTNCKNGVESVKKNATDEKRYETKQAANGKFFFNLKASNGQVVGKSQMYDTEASMKGGMESVMKNAVNAEIQDLTTA